MDNVISELIDYLAGLISGPNTNSPAAQAFVNNPVQAASSAVGSTVTAAQLQTAAAAVAPTSLALSGGGHADPIVGLQSAVANHHGIANTFAPQHTFAPDVASHNATQVASNNDLLSHNPIASNNDVLSPDQHSGANSQVGGFNLGFGDITFGDKNTASNGGVITGDNNDGDILTGGSVKQEGDDNVANTGDVETGDGSPVIIGNDNDVDNTNVDGDGNVVGDDNDGNSTGDVDAGPGSVVQAGGIGNESDSSGSVTSTGDGDVIAGNDGPVVKTGDIDASGGGASGGDGGHGGGILTGGGGDGGSATGGSGGGVIINVPTDQSTNTGGGDVTTVDTGGGDISGSVDASHDDNSQVDNSQTDNSTHDSHDATVETNVDVSNDVGIF